MSKSPHLLLVTLLVANLLGASSLAAAEASDQQLIFHTEWKGERIALPPGFAPTMTLKGVEEIRFAPGMFNPKSDTFFTYAFVFAMPKTQELTPELIKQEMLTYYRGLAEAVSKGKVKPADSAKFSFTLEPVKTPSDPPKQLPASTKVVQYNGDLNWIEPFATGQPQVLHFELQSWSDPATARNYLFVCTSPRARVDTDVVWKELREIRRSFEVTGR